MGILLPPGGFFPKSGIVGVGNAVTKGKKKNVRTERAEAHQTPLIDRHTQNALAVKLLCWYA